MKLIIIPFLALLSISFNSYAETIRDKDASDFFWCDIDGGGSDHFAFHKDKNMLSKFEYSTGAFIRLPAALNNGIIEHTYIADDNNEGRITYYIDTNNFSYKKIYKGTFTKFKITMQNKTGRCKRKSKDLYLSFIKKQLNNLESMCFIDNKDSFLYSSYFCEKLCENGINNPSCN